eukprot:scaffold436_cov336-Pavlova_lutheri.AAC.10
MAILSHWKGTFDLHLSSIGRKKEDKGQGVQSSPAIGKDNGAGCDHGVRTPHAHEEAFGVSTAYCLTFDTSN